jgi:hypothetical protein
LAVGAFVILLRYANLHPEIKIVRVFAIFSLLFGLVELSAFVQTINLAPIGVSNIFIGLFAIYSAGIVYRLYKCGYQSLTKEISNRRKCGLFVFLEVTIMFIVLFWVSGLIELYSVFFLGANIPSLKVAFLEIFNMDIGLGMLVVFLVLVYYAGKYPNAQELKDIAAILLLFGLAILTGSLATFQVISSLIAGLFNISITLYLLYIVLIAVSKAKLEKRYSSNL